MEVCWWQSSKQAAERQQGNSGLSDEPVSTVFKGGHVGEYTLGFLRGILVTSSLDYGSYGETERIMGNVVEGLEFRDIAPIKGKHVEIW